VLGGLAVGVGLLGAALFWETAATRNVAKRARDDLARAKLQATSTCNRVALARSLSEYSAYQGTVQWRRAFIASAAIVGLAPAVAGVHYTNPRQVLLLLLLTWVVISNVAGFHDYHARALADTSIQSSLDLALGQFEPSTCDPSIVTPFAAPSV
jgi:hypothetical protein